MTTKADYIKFKLEKAETTIKAAEVLLENNLRIDALSKIYYAAFHIAIALLSTKALYPKTHLGAKSLFNKEFVLSGLVDMEMGKLYGILLAKRFEADYEDFAIIDESEIPKYLEKVKEFFVKAKVMLVK